MNNLDPVVVAATIASILFSPEFEPYVIDRPNNPRRIYAGH